MSRSPLHRVRYTFGQPIYTRNDETVPSDYYTVSADEELFRKWRWRVKKWRAVGVMADTAFDCILSSGLDRPLHPGEGVHTVRAGWSGSFGDTLTNIHSAALNINAFYLPADPTDPAARPPVIDVNGALWGLVDIDFFFQLADTDGLMTSVEPNPISYDPLYLSNISVDVDGTTFNLYHWDEAGWPVGSLALTVEEYYSYGGIYDTTTGAVNPGRNPLAEGPV